MKNLLQLSIFSFLLAFHLKINAQVTDINGQTYKTVVIGSQTWMAENLNVDRFKNGDQILEAKTNEEWITACNNFQPAWCYYQNDPKNGAKFGKLYNFWAVIDARGIAPSGWRVPSDDDFDILKKIIGAYKLSEVELGSKPIYKTEITYKKIPAHPEEKYVSCSNCSYWTKEQKKYNPCTKCKNAGYFYIKTGKMIPEKTEKIEKKILISGFENGQDKFGLNILTTGKRTKDGFSGVFETYGRSGYLWSSSFFQGSDFGNALGFGYDIGYSDHNITQGFSIRCIKGESESYDSKKSEKQYEFAIYPIQYKNYYPDEIVPTISNAITQQFNSKTELNFIYIKTDFICSTTYCCGFLEYIYNGIDGTDNIVGYKVSKSETVNEYFFSFISSSTSLYNKTSETYGPVKLNKITDLLYETIDGKYKVLFQLANIHCETSSDLIENLHIKVINIQKDYKNTLIGYQLNWMETIGGAHWSGGGSSYSGHNQNWAINEVLNYLGKDAQGNNSISGNSPFGGPVQRSEGNAINHTGGSGHYKARTRLNNVSIPSYNLDFECRIAFKLQVDADGQVVNVRTINSISTCVDDSIIIDLKNRILREVRYNKDPGASIIEIDYTIKLIPK
jgi:uncharacterized protein (TIGR02145 family)